MQSTVWFWHNGTKEREKALLDRSIYVDIDVFFKIVLESASCHRWLWLNALFGVIALVFASNAMAAAPPASWAYPGSYAVTHEDCLTVQGAPNNLYYPEDHFDNPPSTGTATESCDWYGDFNGATGGWEEYGDVIERPMNQNQDDYYPRLDIERIRIGADDNWFYFAIDVVGTGDSDDLADFFSYEIDTDLDGGGDYYVIVKSPKDLLGGTVVNGWSQKDVEVWSDENESVGAAQHTVAEGAVSGDGYENEYWKDDGDEVWTRISPTDPTVVELAIKYDLLSSPLSAALRGWVQKGSQDSKAFYYQDQRSAAEYGSPYPTNPYFPQENIYEIDNSSEVGKWPEVTLLGVEVPPDEEELTCASDTAQTVVYTKSVTNTSVGQTDSYKLTVNSTQGWTVKLYNADGSTLIATDTNGDGSWDSGTVNTGNVLAGQSVDYQVHIVVPGGTAAGTVDTTNLYAESDINSAANDSADSVTRLADLNSFESDYTTLQETFYIGFDSQVRTDGDGYIPGADYVVAYYDSTGDLVTSFTKTADGSGNIPGADTIDQNSDMGQWSAVVYRLGDTIPPTYTPADTNIICPAVFGVRGFDWSDAPQSYATSKGASVGQGGPHHVMPVTGGPALHMGSVVELDLDGAPVAAGGDNNSPNGDGEEEDGVVFSWPAGGDITATVTGKHSTGSAAMLCGYFDGAADGTVNNGFTSNITYVAGEVGLGSDATPKTGNEEVCIQVPAAGGAATSATYGAVTGFSGASASCAATDGSGNFTCTLEFKPGFTASGKTYARFRLTSDPTFFSNSSPSPTGLATNGEVEDYWLDYNPTAVTIGDVELGSIPVPDFLSQIGLDQMDVTALYALLTEWAPDLAASVDANDREAILTALAQYLDSDGDGQVAIIAWQTLEERGTIGFYVERQEDGGSWITLNDEMLPGLITAPMGGEYMLADPQAVSGRLYRYQLIEQEARGTQRSYGPFELEIK